MATPEERTRDRYFTLWERSRDRLGSAPDAGAPTRAEFNDLLRFLALRLPMFSNAEEQQDFDDRELLLQRRRQIRVYMTSKLDVDPVTWGELKILIRAGIL